MQIVTIKKHKVVASLAGWREMQERPTGIERDRVDTTRWVAPTTGKIKANIDAGWIGVDGMGFGMVLCDHGGN